MKNEHESGFIKRGNETDPFTTVYNELLTHTGLSFGAKGLMCYLLHHKEGWITHKSHIKKKFKIGRTALDNMFKELESAGYLVSLDMIRKSGKFIGKNYVFYKKPTRSGKLEEFTDARLPSAVTPTAVTPSTVKQQLISTNPKQLLKKIKTNEREGERSVPAPTTVFESLKKEGGERIEPDFTPPLPHGFTDNKVVTEHIRAAVREFAPPFWNEHQINHTTEDYRRKMVADNWQRSHGQKITSKTLRNVVYTFMRNENKGRPQGKYAEVEEPRKRTEVQDTFYRPAHPYSAPVN